MSRLVFVHDPTDSDPYVIPIGKQTLNPSHIFYRPCSGIWQSVWIESAPANYITSLNLNGDASGQVNMTVETATNSSSNVEVTVKEKGGYGHVVASHSGTTGSPFTFKVDGVKTWSPDTPQLYDVDIKVGGDEVSSYTGFRTIGREEVNGVQRITLNGNSIFTMGTLDQGKKVINVCLSDTR